MKTIIMLLAMSSEHDKELKWWPQAAQARVCRFAIATGYKECTDYMDAKKAHELVIRGQSVKGSPWAYSYEPIQKWPSQGCITLTEGGEKQ